MLDALHDRPIVTVEENNLYGGFGSAVLEYFERSAQLSRVQVHRVGLNDEFGEQATREEQLRMYGLDADGLVLAAHHALQRQVHAAAK